MGAVPRAAVLRAPPVASATSISSVKTAGIATSEYGPHASAAARSASARARLPRLAATSFALDAIAASTLCSCADVSPTRSRSNQRSDNILPPPLPGPVIRLRPKGPPAILTGMARTTHISLRSLKRCDARYTIGASMRIGSAYHPLHDDDDRHVAPPTIRTQSPQKVGAQQTSSRARPTDSRR